MGKPYKIDCSAQLWSVFFFKYQTFFFILVIRLKFLYKYMRPVDVKKNRKIIRNYGVGYYIIN